jgi:hypothetical protein
LIRSGNQNDNPEEIEADRIDKTRMEGVAAAEEDVSPAMDRDIRPFSVDKVFKQDGTLSKSASWVMEGKNTPGTDGRGTRKKPGSCVNGCGKARLRLLPERIPQALCAGTVITGRSAASETAKPVSGTRKSHIRILRGKTRCAKQKSSV